ncbi:hypothetical protein CAPI_01725 [Corynebacterium capitovis DSM 44611]|uniref:hypothetical protein n=1 Tax=Corynebacterium capitovis TaxID=131081 RepID=UPI000366BC25|nr:hypothetical protein [Corynebacterium capitovis]WKD56919.1 hypothetical protein CAPI_01725 [Corynebacterium capitovis DSM 44611]
MLKLTTTQRNWVVLALGAWLLLLVSMALVAASKPAATAAPSYTNSLQQSLAAMEPAEGDAVVSQMVDPSRVYDDNYAGYITLCPDEPASLIQDKIDQLGINEADVNLSGKYGYVVLLPSEGEQVSLDKVDLRAVNVCTMTMDQAYAINAPLPFYQDNGTWTLGANSQ